MPLFTGPTAVLTGLFTVASLPDPTQNVAKYAYVTNLGGGADMVLSDGTNWKHIRRGMRGVVAPAATIPILPLLSPTIMSIEGTMASSIAVTLQTSMLYPGYEFTVIRPAALGALMGITVGAIGLATTGNLLGNSWTDYQWDGTKLVVLRSSGLL